MRQTQASPQPLGGVANFRDFGGYATRSGGVVRTGLLFRSGHMAQALPQDIETLGALGVSHVADLRRPEERAKLPTPDALARSWTTLSHNHPYNSPEPPHLAVLLAPDVSEAAVDARMISGYRQYPHDPALSEVYRAYFDALCDQDEGQAVLVHCHAGKDRTGFLIALTHHLLEVSPDAMMSDYLRTNQETRVDERMPEVLASFEKEHGVAPPLEALRRVMMVAGPYLQAAMDSVQARYGSLDLYLEQHLGVDAAKTQRIRQRLVRRA